MSYKNKSGIRDLNNKIEGLKAQVEKLKEIEQGCKEVYDDNKRWVNDLAGDEASDALYWTMKRILKIEDKN